MFRREEMREHERKAERLDDRAFHQAERGHFDRAANLETRSDIQRAEVIGAAVGPPFDPYYRPVGVGMVAAERQAEEMREIRDAEMIAATRRIEGREIREAEMMAATRPVYPAYPPARVDVIVEPGMPGVYPVAGYPPGVYPPAAGYGYPPPGEYPRY